jgi:hypothetical protein
VVERSVQLLACEFRIAVDCERLAGWLDETVSSAIQAYPVSRHYRFEVSRVDGAYRIREDGNAPHVALTLEAAAEHIRRRLHELSLAALTGYTKVHAGCATWAGRRLLAVGAAGSGKTTLMARLLWEGFAVHGDEMVLLRDGGSIAYPRRFGIRAPTLDLVPQIGALAPALARAGQPHGDKVLVLDPHEIGLPWRIEPGPVGAVFYLDANHGRRTEVRACARHLMVQRVMPQSAPPAGGPSRWIAEVCAIIERADCYTLALGDLDAAVHAVQQVLDRADGSGALSRGA